MTAILQSKAVILLLILSAISGLAQPQAGDYEFIENGDFEQGNTGFDSELMYSFDLTEEGRYYITDDPTPLNPHFPSCGDHTTGDGNMMVINSDTLEFSRIIWKQTATGFPVNEKMLFSFHFATITHGTPALLRVKINDEWFPEDDTLELTTSSCQWKKLEMEWDPKGYNVAEIEIYNLRIEIKGKGNDFALDDITLRQKCKLDISNPNEYTVCRGSTVKLQTEINDAFYPVNFRWEPADLLNDPFAPEPLATVTEDTEFYLSATDSIGCDYYDTVRVNVSKDPGFDISSDSELPACPCDSVILSYPDGFNYLWSTGETSNSIKVHKPGEYFLTIIDDYGCTFERSFTVDMFEPQYYISLRNATGEPGDKVSFDLVIDSIQTQNNCYSNNLSGFINYNPTILTPAWTEDVSAHGKYESAPFSTDLSQSHQFDFYVTLGDSTCSPVSLGDLSYSCAGFESFTSSITFCLEDLCEGGGTRLFSDRNAQAFLEISPNPAVKELSISYSSFESGKVFMGIYDLNGKLVKTLIDGYTSKGANLVKAPIHDLVSGVYLLMYFSPGFNDTKQFAISK